MYWKRSYQGCSSVQIKWCKSKLRRTYRMWWMVCNSGWNWSHLKNTAADMLFNINMLADAYHIYNIGAGEFGRRHFQIQIRQWNNQSLVQIMSWCRPGDKPLSEPMMVFFSLVLDVVVLCLHSSTIVTPSRVHSGVLSDEGGVDSKLVIPI